MEKVNRDPEGHRKRKKNKAMLFSISVWMGVLDSPEITGSLRGQWCLFQRFCRELVAEAVNVPSRRPKEEIRKPFQWLPN